LQICDFPNFYAEDVYAYSSMRAHVFKHAYACVKFYTPVKHNMFNLIY